MEIDAVVSHLTIVHVRVLINPSCCWFCCESELCGSDSLVCVVGIGNKLGEIYICKNK